MRERIRRIQAVVRNSHGSEERSQMKPSLRQLAKKASTELNQCSAAEDWCWSTDCSSLAYTVVKVQKFKVSF